MLDMLMKAGLPVLADMLIAKGEAAVKDFVKDKTGIDLDKGLPNDAAPLTDLDVELELERTSSHRVEQVAMIDLEDVKSAREQAEIMLTSKDTINRLFLPVFSLITATAMISFMVFYPNLRTEVLMLFVSLVTMIFSFWFGSSHGSRSKDEALATKQNALKEAEFGGLL